MNVVVVTGASSGIGRAVARRVDADVVVAAGRHPGRLEDLTGADGTPVVPWGIDLTDVDAVGASWANMWNSLGPRARLTGVVHSAGVVELAAVGETTADIWQGTLTLNVTAPALLTAAVLPQLREARGTVVFVNSTSGFTANPQWGAYSASKWALRAVADTLRTEEAPNGVRVASVFPSRTDTAMQRQVRQMERGPYEPERYLSADVVAAAIVGVLNTPTGATVTDVTLRPMPAESPVTRPDAESTDTNGP